MALKTLSIVGFALLAIAPLLAQKPITAAEARSHIGEPATVCGKVVGTLFAERSRGRPTFLDVDKPYAERVFTVLIWGMDRSKFGEPENTYRGKRICVTGKIEDYKGTPEIVASEPSQVKMQ
jgi:DNA/RNA endonuclease YhcR with UshA esterase domain